MLFSFEYDFFFVICQSCANDSIFFLRRFSQISCLCNPFLFILLFSLCFFPSFSLVCFFLSTYSKHLLYKYYWDISIDGIYSQFDNLVYVLRNQYPCYIGNPVYINSYCYRFHRLFWLYGLDVCPKRLGFFVFIVRCHFSSYSVSLLLSSLCFFPCILGIRYICTIVYKMFLGNSVYIVLLCICDNRGIVYF